MKKGISIWSFPQNTLKDNFALAKDAGFDGVEVALDEDPGEINLKSTEKDLLQVKHLAKETGIELYSVASGLYWSYFLNDEDEKIRSKAQDIVKKHLAQGHELDREHLIKELGDIAWYLAETAYALDVELEDVLALNIEKLKKRYPEGFNKEQSINRMNES